jgi:hypothetical protein
VPYHVDAYYEDKTKTKFHTKKKDMINKEFDIEQELNGFIA